MSAPAHLILALLSLLILASDLSAQGIRGRVLDADTERPVTGATVTLLGPDETVIRGALTGDDGEFVLPISRSGRYMLRAERIGYAAVTSHPLDLIAGDSLTVELRMGTEAVTLAPLTVTASPRRSIRDRTLDDFYRRQLSGWGTHYGPAEIDRLRPMSVTNLLQGTPGVRIQYLRGMRTQIMMQNARGYCRPTLFVDGSRLPTDEIDSWISGSSLRAVEVYNRAIEIPGEFISVRNYDCGAIVIWTNMRVDG
jgi:hypothetical protein